MQIQKNVALDAYTSLGVGGPAELLAECGDPTEISAAVTEAGTEQIQVLGFGTNSLISDSGLTGLTIMLRGGVISQQDDMIIADAGVWWDDLVLYALSKKLWGIELMSGIPSSVGGAVFGNIAAYGQQLSDCLVGVEVFDLKDKTLKSLRTEEIDFAYRSSSLQTQPNLIITKVAIKLVGELTTPLKYESARVVAKRLKLDETDLESRRTIIMEARKRAGSLFDPGDPETSHSAGSFFKNPQTDLETAKKLSTFDETGKTLERILAMNTIHGGNKARVSAAHVLLAAGFKRGQSWGAVRLHPEHVLKIENTGGATAQEIYDVAQLIITTVQEKLSITLEPEVKFLGEFSS